MYTRGHIFRSVFRMTKRRNLPCAQFHMSAWWTALGARRLGNSRESSGYAPQKGMTLDINGF